jgi:hypothetical protein
VTRRRRINGSVIAGLDTAIHLFRKSSSCCALRALMDARVKPAHDAPLSGDTSSSFTPSLPAKRGVIRQRVSC